MKKIFTSLLLGVLATPGLFAQSQGDDLLNIHADARVDFQNVWDDGSTVKSNSGFQFKYLNLRVDGSIIPGLTYSWRQRFTKSTFDGNFLDATDWIYLDWRVKDWSFSAGKQVVAIGGWEYDRAPIDILCGSVFWNNIPCYDVGASVAYHLTKDDALKLQVTQSPFFTKENRAMYAYNLYWDGKHGPFHALWSANMIEYLPGKYINYIALGNRFEFDKVTIELDLMNRAASGQTYLFKDCSVVGEVAYAPNSRWNVFAKASYDVNKSGTEKDFTVSNGTELSMAGVGVEFFPLRTRKTDLRLHADCFYAWGNNTNSADVMQNKTTFFNVGLKWNMHIVNLKRKNTQVD